jgi:hypothetical protein
MALAVDMSSETMRAWATELYRVADHNMPGREASAA